MDKLIPETLFAPELSSERLTYTVFNESDESEESDATFTAHVFNANFHKDPTKAPTTVADIFTLCKTLRLAPSDTHGKLSKDPAIYVVHLGQAPGKRIGVVNLCRRSSQFAPDFGFMLLPEYQRHGYGTEAATRMMRYWRDEFGIKEICSYTTAENIASRKLLTRIGLQEHGWVFLSGGHRIFFSLPGMPGGSGEEISFSGEPPASA